VLFEGVWRFVRREKGGKGEKGPSGIGYRGAATSCLYMFSAAQAVSKTPCAAGFYLSPLKLETLNPG
jgi:hypothetical protein